VIFSSVAAAAAATTINFCLSDQLFQSYFRLGQVPQKLTFGDYWSITHYKPDALPDTQLTESQY